MIEPDGDSGEFTCFDSLDALAAYVHFRYGAEMLRELLRTITENDKSTSDYGLREQLEDAAAELSKRHLDQPATILREIALMARSGIENIPDYWHGMEDHWQRKWITHRKAQTGELQHELRRQHARNQRLSEINGQKPAHHQR